MSNPDRDPADQESRPGRTNPAGTTSSPSSDDDPAPSRARVKPPKPPAAPRRADFDGAGAGAPEQPAFIRKGGTVWPEQARDDGPKIPPDLGLDRLGANTGDRARADNKAAGNGTRSVRPPRKSEPKIRGDLTGQQEIRGSHIGDRYVRIVRQQSDDFARAGPGHLVATEEAIDAREAASAAPSARVKRTLIGRAAHRLPRPRTSG